MLARDTVQRPLFSCLRSLCAPPVALAATLLFVLPTSAVSAQSPLDGKASTPRSGPGQLHQEHSARSNEPREEGVLPSDLDIVDGDSDVAPEDRTYTFDIENGTYEQLIDTFARQTGLGVIGQPPRGTGVDLITTDELTFEEALRRVRMLLFNYKPNNPYWLVRHDTHFEVILVHDVLQILPEDRMFRSVEELHAAELPDEELVLVIYAPEVGSVSDLATIRDFMPDYVRITPLEGQNAVAIFALVGDVEKYLSLIDFFVEGGNDPRTLEIIEVEHILPSGAVHKLRLLMDLGDSGKAVARRRGRRTRGAGRKSSARRSGAVSAMSQPEVSVVPDDLRGVLIVRAMDDVIEEIKLLLPYVDVDKSSPSDPIVVRVEHADAAEVMETVRVVLASSEGSAAKPSPKKQSKARRSRRSKGSRKSKRTRTHPARMVTVDDLTMMVHPEDNAIILMGDDEDATRARHLIELLDVKDRVGPIRIDLEYANAREVSDSLGELLSFSRRGGRSGSEDPVIVPDASGNAVWFEGSEPDLATVRELIARMDSAEEAVSLHVARLSNQTPSLVAGILREYDDDSSAKRTAARPKRGRRPKRSSRRRTTRRAARSRTVAVSKFTPDDQQSRLYVLCTEQEWAEYLPIIEQLDNAADDPAKATRLSLRNTEPQKAIDKLTALFGSRDDGVRFAVAQNDILVTGASSAQIDAYRSVIAELDQSTELVEQTFDIEHADPSALMAAIQSLVGEERAARPKQSRRGRRRRQSEGTFKSDELTIVRLGDQLIVRATPAKMEEVARLIEEFDVAQRDTELRTYDDFPPGTGIEEIAETLSSVVNGTSRPSRHRRGRRSAQPTLRAQFVPQPTSGRLVVRAESSVFPEIEALLEVLTSGENVGELEIVYVNVAFADPQELADAIDPILSLKVDELIATRQLEDNPIRAVPSVRGRRKRAPSTRQNPYYLLAPDGGNERLVIASRPIVIDEAAELITVFDQPGDEPDKIEIVFLDVEFADPVALVSLIDPLLSMKVRELIAAGELGEKAIQSGPRPRRRAGRRPRRTPQSRYYHLAADAQNSRIVIAAPQRIIDEATQLVAAFDEPNDSEDLIIRTVELSHTDPAEMVKSIGEVKGISLRRGVRRGRRSRADLAAASTEQFSILVAPGGGALVVRGKPGEVEETLKWIETLDGMSSITGRSIKVYSVEYVDIVRLGDLIMNTVEPPAQRPAKRFRRGKRIAPVGEEDEFTTTKTWVGKDVYMRAEVIDGALIVSATKPQLARIDEIVEQLDVREHGPVLSDAAVPKLVYELEHVDAIDAAFELETALDVLWEPGDVLPTVDYASSLGNILIVRYPDEQRFPEIEELIVQYVDTPDRKAHETRRRAIAVPRGMTAEEAARWLKNAHPELDIEVHDASEGKDSSYGVDQVSPQRRQEP